MKQTGIVVALFAAGMLAGCSGGHDDPLPTTAGDPPADTFTAPVDDNTSDLAVPSTEPSSKRRTPKPVASDIVNHYDSATCADWKVTSGRNRTIVSEYFAVTRASDLGDVGPVLKQAITTACGAPGVPASTTVHEVAVRSIKILRGDG